MASTGLWDDIAGLAAVPVVMWVLTTGLGLLVERAARARIPNALLAPLGLCAALVLCLGLYTTHAGDTVVLPVLIVLVVAGFVLARRELPARCNGGWPLAAGLAAYLLFNSSVIATGHWTIVGYHLQDDTAFEMLLARHLQTYGTALGALPVSTATSFIQGFLSTGYPLGAQSLLGALGGLMHADVAVIYQGYVSSLAAVGAMAASTLSGRAFGPRLSALVGFFAISAALTFQYAMQGSIKEIGTAVAVLCALSLIRIAILELGLNAAAVIVAIALATILATYNAAGLPYVGALAGTGLVAAVIVHWRPPTWAWVRAAAVGVAVFGVMAAAALSTIATFFHIATSGYTGTNAVAPPLGQLLRPLPLSELNGIWLVRDYRIMVSPGLLGDLEVAGTVAMLLLAALGTVYALVRREPGIAIGIATMGLVLIVVYPTAIPYVQGKLLAIASPVVVLGAAQGLGAFGAWRRTRPFAALLGIALGAGILGSDALAYHGEPVAPTSQLIALEQVGRAIGPHGPVLVSEFQEFAKYFAAPARLIVGTEYPTPENLVLRQPGGLYGQSFDLDAEQLSSVESFPYILVRRSPTASRPPANFRLTYENYYYSVWKRSATPRVLDHLPLQALYSGEADVSCPALAAMVANAPKASRLVVSHLPAMVGYDVLHATVRSTGWPQDFNPYRPDAVAFATPGVAGTVVTVPRTGNYRIWLQGTSPRLLRITLGAHNRTVSHIGANNTPDEWLEGASVHLRRGRYAFDVWRPAGDLSPGDGGTGESYEGRGEIGYLALVSESQPSMVSLPVKAWRTLCGHPADWVELVSTVP